MNLQPIIKHSKEKKLIGIQTSMSLKKSKYIELWSRFMPRRKEITNQISAAIFDLQIYNNSYFKNFKPTHEFEKWVAVEVATFDTIPLDMECFTLKAGNYAVFNYKGLNTDTTIFKYIYGEWLGISEFEIDDRPHFQVLGENYKNNDPNSEEEIWIPIKNN
tara:strand:+ start:198 stop:680 length:483 start_codon:yes stop_codon:yes gene_type:complete